MSASDTTPLAPVETGLGELSIVRATPADLDRVLAVLLDTETWLAGRGLGVWEHIQTPHGRELIRRRIVEHEVYLVTYNGMDAMDAASMTLQWSDPEPWGALGEDGCAAYLHGLSVVRSFAGHGIGAAMLRWAAGAGRPLLRLDCAATNPQLCAYYQRQAFRHVRDTIVRTRPTRLWEKAVICD